MLVRCKTIVYEQNDPALEPILVLFKYADLNRVVVIDKLHYC